MSAVVKKEKVVTKARDPSLPPRSIRYSLPDLIELIPKPEPGTPQDEWEHKNGWGLKFYRKRWARYAEPSYWTVTRYKPSTHGHKRKVWGVLTWRGQTASTAQHGKPAPAQPHRDDERSITSVNPLSDTVTTANAQAADSAQQQRDTAAHTPRTARLSSSPAHCVSLLVLQV